jgi:hypothetical protein
VSTYRYSIFTHLASNDWQPFMGLWILDYQQARPATRSEFAMRPFDKCFRRRRLWSAFRSNWHRLMTAAVKDSKRKDGSWISEQVLAEPLTFHDLRASARAMRTTS